MKVLVYCDEYSPFYWVNKSPSSSYVDVPDELVERYDKNMKELEKIQEELKKLSCE